MCAYEQDFGKSRELMYKFRKDKVARHSRKCLSLTHKGSTAQNKIKIKNIKIEKHPKGVHWKKKKGGSKEKRRKKETNKEKKKKKAEGEVRKKRVAANAISHCRYHCFRYGCCCY